VTLARLRGLKDRRRMLSKLLRTRIGELHRSATGSWSVAAPPRFANCIREAAEEHLPAGRVEENSAGAHWLIEKPLTTLWPGATRCLEQWGNGMRPHDRGRTSHGEIAAFRAHFPAGTLFLDLETCGLAGSAIFLAGILRHTDAGLVLKQLWARNYAEEHALLKTLTDELAAMSLLVTFNGKSFDWPQVCDRWARYQPLRALPHFPHFDLLHHARRRWRGQLPNCRLQTLERFLCGRHRVGDIPGREIPAAYRQYVQDGDVASVRPILHHNALDLVTLLQIALQISG
jgi:hypothetical protein